MKYDDDLEKRFTAIFGIVGTLAILFGVAIKGFSFENILDAVKDISGLVIGVAVFLVASTISRRSRTFLDVAESALSKLQQQNSALLEGPKFDKADYVPPDKDNKKRIKFLFFSSQSLNTKIAFIPLNSLEDGILEIRVSKQTLINLNNASTSVTDEKLALVQRSVSENTEAWLKKSGCSYEIIHSKSEPDETVSTSSRYPRTAIIIDFDEQKLGMKKFEKVIIECGQEALKSILEFKQ